MRVILFLGPRGQDLYSPGYSDFSLLEYDDAPGLQYADVPSPKVLWSNLVASILSITPGPLAALSGINSKIHIHGKAQRNIVRNVTNGRHTQCQQSDRGRRVDMAW